MKKFVMIFTHYNPTPSQILSLGYFDGFSFFSTLKNDEGRSDNSTKTSCSLQLPCKTPVLTLRLSIPLPPAQPAVRQGLQPIAPVVLLTLRQEKQAPPTTVVLFDR